jgi:uncharacterized protein (DUF58 family)
MRRDAPAADPGPASLTDAAFLRTLDRLALQTQRRLRGDNIGQRASYRRLPASDFREHRVYQPGDDLRHVDWNASARAEHVFIKMGEQTKEASLHLLLDSSASMQWGQPSKLWAGRRLAAALGFIALNYGDRLTVSDAASSAAPFGPRWARRTCRLCCATCASCRCSARPTWPPPRPSMPAGMRVAALSS